SSGSCSTPPRSAPRIGPPARELEPRTRPSMLARRRLRVHARLLLAPLLGTGPRLESSSREPAPRCSLVGVFGRNPIRGKGSTAGGRPNLNPSVSTDRLATRGAPVDAAYLTGWGGDRRNLDSARGRGRGAARRARRRIGGL